MFRRDILPEMCLLTFLFGAVALAEKQRSGLDLLETFRQDTLIHRFDVNQDDVLSVPERKELRRAFGNIDVPMLPRDSYRYAQDKLPTHISTSELRECDNTPADNPLTDAGATLGRVLFYDKQLSRNNVISCASCHPQKQAFSDPNRYSEGFEGGRTKRTSMGLANLRYTVLRGSRPGFFWDERAPSLEAQALMPIQDKVEMGMELPALEMKLHQLPYYPPLFEAAFRDTEVTSDRIAKSLAQFMRSMVSFDSRFDRAAAVRGGNDYAEDFAEFTAQENLGKSLFIDGVAGIAEIGCAHCHIPPTFGMPKSFNNGLDLHYRDPGLGARDVPSNDVFTPNNDGKFKAPSLRNIAITAPYMHDGRFKTLEEVIEHYSDGVHPHVNLGLAFNDQVSAESAETSGFALTGAQKVALVSFLKTLTDATLVTDPRFSDPFVRVTN